MTGYVDSSYAGDLDSSFAPLSSDDRKKSKGIEALLYILKGLRKKSHY